MFTSFILPSLSKLTPCKIDVLAHGNHGGEGKSPLHHGRFVPNKRILELREKLLNFMEDHVYPMESEFYKLAQSNLRWTIHPQEERLKELAKTEGLWNLWIPVCAHLCCCAEPILLLFQ